MRVRIRIVVSCVPVQCRRWNMKRFCKLALLAHEQLLPCSGTVLTKPFRVLTMQGIDDRPDVAVVRGQVVHRRSQLRIFLPPEQAVRAMLFRAGARGNVLKIALHPAPCAGASVLPLAEIFPSAMCFLRTYNTPPFSAPFLSAKKALVIGPSKPTIQRP